MLLIESVIKNLYLGKSHYEKHSFIGHYFFLLQPVRSNPFSVIGYCPTALMKEQSFGITKSG